MTIAISLETNFTLLIIHFLKMKKVRIMIVKTTQRKQDRSTKIFAQRRKNKISF